MSSYRQKFIIAVKKITRCDNYQDGLKKFELLALVNINHYRKHGGNWKDWVMTASDLNDDEMDYMRDKIESESIHNCICSHLIEKLSFWKFENIIYLIGCDCVKQYPYFDKFMVERLRILEEDLENLRKQQEKKTRALKKQLENAFKKLESQTNELFDSYIQTKERKINDIEKKIKDNDHQIFNFLKIQLNFRDQKKSIKQLIKDKNIAWYIKNHKFFTYNQLNLNKINYIIDNKSYPINFEEKYGWV